MRIVASLLLVGSIPACTVATDEQVIIVKRATVVAFFTPVTEEQLDKDADTNEALADFQLSVAQVREPLEKAGVDFHEVYARSFQIQDGNTSTTFRPQPIEVGYYFVGPGKQPRVEYGVITGGDLFTVLREYFGITLE